MGLEALLNALDAQAQARSQEIERNTEREVETLWREARDTIGRERLDSIARHEQRFTEEVQRREARERQKTRGRELQARADCLQRVREACEQHVESLGVATYAQAAPQHFAEATTHLRCEGSVLRCSNEVTDVLRHLAQRRDVEVVADDTVGLGFILEEAEGRARVDQTMRARLVARWPALSIGVVARLPEVGPL